MNIEIRDRVLEARIQRQIEATGSGSVEEVLLRLLETPGGTGSLALGKPGGERRKNPTRNRATRPGRGDSRRPAGRLPGGIEIQA